MEKIIFTTNNPPMEWVARYQVLNYLISKYQYENYLEIGVNTGDNISKINAKNIDGVDPVKQHPMTNFEMTSNDFFEQLDVNKKYDIIFIDGLHLYEQVIKDIDNSLKHLNPNGIILLHDCNPTQEHHQYRDPVYNQPWNGDVWKAILHFRKTRSDLQMCTINTDYGLGVIAPGEQDIYENNDYENVADYTYEFFDKNRVEILNLVSFDQFISWV